MKKHLLTTLFSLFVMASAAQDTLQMRDGRKIIVSVLKVTPTTIEFTYLNESTVNVLEKNDAAKIIYKSGRVETILFQPNNTPAPKNKPVAVKYRYGLKAGATLPFISNLGNSTTNKVGPIAGFTSEFRFLGTQHGLTIEALVAQLSAEGKDDIGAIIDLTMYQLCVPIMYAFNPSDRFVLHMGFEPGLVLSAKATGYGSEINLSSVTNESYIGLTGGFRYYIMPRSWFLDARITRNLTDTFTNWMSKANKASLTVGYLLKY